MRRMFVIATIAGLLTATMASCAREPRATVPSAKASSAGGAEAEVYAQVLARYLGTPSENSFPGHTFPAVYVLDQAYPDAADPSGKPQQGVPIEPDAQRSITAAVPHLTFIADRASVLATKNGCPQVKNGGILITLGTADGDNREVHVGINGFVACLGATWLTYVVQHQAGGWRVTGTTGPMAIS